MPKPTIKMNGVPKENQAVLIEIAKAGCEIVLDTVNRQGRKIVFKEKGDCKIMINIEQELKQFLQERDAHVDKGTWENMVLFAWGYSGLIRKETITLYNELVDKVSSWWDEVYPADIFTGVSGDDGVIRVAEIRELLDEIKALPERSNP